MAQNRNQGGPDRGQSQSGRGTTNPARNLTEEDRRRGGEESAATQGRDEQGQFAGRSNEGRERSGRGGSGETDTGNEGRRRGGQESATSQQRDQQGQFVGNAPEDEGMEEENERGRRGGSRDTPEE